VGWLDLGLQTNSSIFLVVGWLDLGLQTNSSIFLQEHRSYEMPYNVGSPSITPSS
jgi:hypothetical protein